jgi:hypothetical protein
MAFTPVNAVFRAWYRLASAREHVDFKEFVARAACRRLTRVRREV